MEKYACEAQSAQAQDRILDPAELDLEPGQDEPECAFRDLKCETQHTHCLIVELLTSFYQDTCYQEAHVHLRSLSILHLARKKHDVGEMKYTQKTELIHFFHLGLAKPTRYKFVWEKGQAFMQCRLKGQWKTVTKFEVRTSMAYASQMQFEVPRCGLWV